MEQGSVLRRKESAQKTQEKLSLNPFGTGQCLTTAKDKQMSNREESLNPFGTGQCLTTIASNLDEGAVLVSIPLEQGSVLRLNFTSIWNRS